MIEREFDNRTSLIVDPPDGRIPSLTAERAAAKARGRRDSPAAIRRAGGSHPRRAVPDLWGAAAERHEHRLPDRSASTRSSRRRRTSCCSSRPCTKRASSASTAARTFRRPSACGKGTRAGAWERETLVVDTTNFSARNNFMGSSDRLHLVERSSPASRQTRSTIRSPSTIRPRGRSRGRRSSG